MSPQPAPFNRRVLIVDDTASIHEDFQKILCPPKTEDDSLDATESLLFGTPSVNNAVHFELDFAFQGQQALQKLEAALAADPVERQRPGEAPLLVGAGHRRQCAGQPHHR